MPQKSWPAPVPQKSWPASTGHLLLKADTYLSHNPDGPGSAAPPRAGCGELDPEGSPHPPGRCRIASSQYIRNLKLQVQRP